MIAALRQLRKDKRGASVAEFALILPILLGLTFGIIEVGILAWQLQLGSFASKKAVRIASTRSLVVPGSLPDCGVSANGFPAGTVCSDIPGSSGWSVTCSASNCGPDFDRVVQEIVDIYPQAAPENIQIELQGAGLGFVGLGRPVPIITVSFVGLTYDFPVLSNVLGLGSVNLPVLSASAPAEDLTNGGG